MGKECWLRVEELLPDNGDRVLIWSRGREGVLLAEYTISNWWLEDGHGRWSKEWEVTHWMPLPPSPFLPVEGGKRRAIVGYWGLTRVLRCDILSVMRRTTIHLGDVDREAIKVVRERYGLPSNSGAIRMAIRLLAATPPQPPAEKREGEWARHLKK